MALKLKIRSPYNFNRIILRLSPFIMEKTQDNSRKFMNLQ